MTDIGRFLARNRLAAVGAATLALMLLAVVLAPLVAPSPIAVDVANRLAPPGSAHPLGTDPLGRDVLARVLHGGGLPWSSASPWSLRPSPSGWSRG
ncbi:hypothetical protein ACE7GA_06745 [Roseomonas sp. CCTCC AB2023176]|uniref:hypothetical protein n=1 Tax=Roseomonas sp. CCTCC AB2023176 TaxID=3342640 RepID=UPI0035D63E37